MSDDSLLVVFFSGFVCGHAAAGAYAGGWLEWARGVPGTWVARRVRTPRGK
jgi:hypothetical protein